MTLEIYVAKSRFNLRRYDAVIIDRDKPLPPKSFGWNAKAALNAPQEYNTRYHDNLSFPILVELVAEKAGLEIVCLNNSIPKKYAGGSEYNTLLNEDEFKELSSVLNLDDVV